VKNSARAARVTVSADCRGLVSQAGAVLLWETMRVTGLARGLSENLARWWAPQAVHDPGKIVRDLAAALALSGDCLADIAVLRDQPEFAGAVASDPVVSRLFTALAADEKRALKAIRAARAGARERWLEHRRRPNRDHRLVLAQLRRRVLIRTDSGGGAHGFLDWLTAKSRRLHYSAGMPITEDMQAAILNVPADGWTPAYDAAGRSARAPGSRTSPGLLDLSDWPEGMRVIVRKERPHSGAQLRFTNLDGHRFTTFATDAEKGHLADWT
jgi:hypothetical protein